VKTTAARGVPLAAGQHASSPGDRDSGRSLVGRVFRTLELIAATPMTPSTLAQALDVDRSSALRLLRQLSAAGYVARDDRSGRYGTVGPRFLQLVSYAPDHTGLIELVDPVLRTVRLQYGEATLLAVPARGSMVYAAFFPSREILGVREQLGSIRPMHCSAVGKAYLSALDEDALELELGRIPFEGGTAHAPQVRDTLYRQVLQARRSGFALDQDETSLGVSCVAVPLRVGVALIGAIGLTGPSTRLSDALLRRIGRELAATGSSLGRLAGRPT
jgi:IclR family acetate operon transcriptional repressor